MGPVLMTWPRPPWAGGIESDFLPAAQMGGAALGVLTRLQHDRLSLRSMTINQPVVMFVRLGNQPR
jgi:hypothetical protein